MVVLVFVHIVLFVCYLRCHKNITVKATGLSWIRSSEPFLDPHWRPLTCRMSPPCGPSWHDPPFIWKLPGARSMTKIQNFTLSLFTPTVDHWSIMTDVGYVPWPHGTHGNSGHVGRGHLADPTQTNWPCTQEPSTSHTGHVVWRQLSLLKSCTSQDTCPTPLSVRGGEGIPRGWLPGHRTGDTCWPWDTIPHH